MTGIKIKIDVTKIPREAIFQGQKGKYVDLVIFENQNGEDQFGNSHSVQLDQTKEARQRGDKKIYVGNGKWLGNSGGGQQGQVQQRQQPARTQQRPPVRQQEAPPDDDMDSIPF